VGAAQGEKRPINSVASSAAQGEKRGRKAAPKTLSKEDMDEFKDAVVGSQLGKLELCKGLKAR
jgi:chromatin assembly factor 1 subunit A